MDDWPASLALLIHTLKMPDSRSLAGLVLLMLRCWRVVEGVFMLSVFELLLAAGFAFRGWRLRPRGKAIPIDTATVTPGPTIGCWARFVCRTSLFKPQSAS
jgi:hypothetical protein